MRVLLLILTLSLISCNTTKQTINATTNTDGYLVGLADKTNFEKAPFNEWFIPNYKEYSLDMQIVSKLKPLFKEVKIKAVMGTWCGDSRRETPHFYKLLDAVDFNYKNLEMITVDRSKSTPNNDQTGLNIERVPTFIFYKNGKEINRFVEYPRETLEKDFLKILQEVGYKHSYLD
jgi:thiol-disulfide isomerase/thioredoxin